MTQFRNFHINGTGTSVKSVWSVTIGTVTGTFTLSESITWDSSAGTGTLLSVPISNAIARFSRTSGDFPEEGDLITGSSSGATATITSISTQDETGIHQNPPLFKTSPSQGAVKVNDLVVIKTAAGAFLRKKVLAIPGEDELTIDSGFGATCVDVPTVIYRDFTPNLLLPLPSAGDALVANQIREAFLVLDNQNPVEDWQAGPTLVSGWRQLDAVTSPNRPSYRFRKEHGRVILDGGIELIAGAITVVHGSESVPIFTMPVGYRPTYQQLFTVYDGVVVEINTAGWARILGSASVTTDEVHFEGLSYPVAVT